MRMLAERSCVLTLFQLTVETTCRHAQVERLRESTENMAPTRAAGPDLAIPDRASDIDDVVAMRLRQLRLARGLARKALAAMAGFCAQAAVRRTPLLLDGLVVTAAALVAERLAPDARLWWQAGHRSPEPAHQIALNELGLTPIIDLGLRLGEGTGAAVALPIVRAAVATLSSMATFDDAGVSGPEQP